jgi:hypothetical protein
MNTYATTQLGTRAYNANRSHEQALVSHNRCKSCKQPWHYPVCEDAFEHGEAKPLVPVV